MESTRFDPPQWKLFREPPQWKLFREPPQWKMIVLPPQWKLFAKLFWLTTTNESTKKIITETETNND